jgi:membrane-bound ClpP family serine protease
MAWFIIISLLLIGLVLLIIEVVFVPGTTVIGILGVIFSIVGVVMTYENFGSTVGFYVLLSTLVVTLVGLFISFKSGVWSKFSNKSSINSRVNEGILAHLKVGDLGVTLSALRPFGKAEFGTTVAEVRSIGSFVEPRSKVKIIQIEGNQIIVDIINDL